MASVTFPPALGGDGSTVTDDSNPSTGLGNGGHRTRFVPSLAQVVIMAQTAVTNATAAAASAASAVNAPGTTATSTTSASIGLGSKSLTIQTGKSLVPGMWVTAADTSAASTNWMAGPITSYNSGTGALVFDSKAIAGSGTLTAWTVANSSPGGATLGRNTFTDAQNFAPTVSIASAATVNIGAAASNSITITGTTTITAFDTIADGAYRELTFSGVLTLTHNATSLILPGGANIQTEAGATALFKSLGGGNWRCVRYTKANGQSVIPATVVRSARTSNTILAAADSHTYIDSTSGTYSQTITAAATLGSGWWCYVGNSSAAGFVTLDPNGAETITVNGVAQTTWVLWPREIGILMCDGSGFRYVCIQKGEITQTISSNVASVSFSTGLAYRRRLSLSITDYSIATTNSAPYLQINSTDSTRFRQLLMVTNAASGNSSGGVSAFNLLATLATGAAATDRMSGSIEIKPDAGIVGVISNMQGLNSGSAGCLTISEGHWTGISESTITSITILQSSTGVIATGNFVLREL